jgi:16S rRNA G966 N2-methylase RsmD
MLQDTLLFLSLGHQVTALEESKILFHLLQDGINRSEDQAIFTKLNLINTNACSYATQAKDFDVIYFDPYVSANQEECSWFWKIGVYWKRF